MLPHVALVALLAACASAAEPNSPEAAKPKVIKPAEARKHVNVLCAVTMSVKASKTSTKRGVVFLDSHEDFNDQSNLGIRIDAEGIKKLAERQIADPAAHFLKKRIRVTGKVVLENDRPYIRIQDPDMIKELGAGDK